MDWKRTDGLGDGARSHYVSEPSFQMQSDRSSQGVMRGCINNAESAKFHGYDDTDYPLVAATSSPKAATVRVSRLTETRATLD